MGILEIVDDICNNDFLIENHPVKELDFENKMLYLYGLSLMMNVDDEIHAKEIEFLEVLIKAFAVEDTVESFIEFAKNPDKKIVCDVINFLKDFEFKKLFLFDAVILLKIDNVEQGCEHKLLEIFTAKTDLLQRDIDKLLELINIVMVSADKDKLTLPQLIKKIYHPLHIKQMILDDKSWISKKSQMEFIFVECGTFQMGSNEQTNSNPIHEVAISTDFWIGKYPVTQGEYIKVIGYNPCKLKFGTKPVEMVSWHDAINFCKKLTEQEVFANNIPKEMEYRLLTEAEWEYCAKGGSKSAGYKYSGSDDGKTVGWVNYSCTRPVGQKEPNELGLYDMTGNVAELCQDNWHEDYTNAPADGSCWHNESDTYIVYRGGSYTDSVTSSLVGYRSYVKQDIMYPHIGFRIALALKKVELGEKNELT